MSDNLYLIENLLLKKIKYICAIKNHLNKAS
jgi:hypothetical protein